MPISPEDATRFARTFAALVDGIAVALLGKESTRLCIRRYYYCV